MNLKLLILSIFVLITSCTYRTKTTSAIPDNPSDETLYSRAVADAAVVDSGDICDSLVAIKKSNDQLIWNSDSSKVLMVMWKSQNSYEQFYKNDSTTPMSEAYVTWVTTAPQVQSFGKGYLQENPTADSLSVTNRMKQYLGLMPEWNYDVFIEIWVNPAQLFRPCVDPQIDDEGCSISFDNELPTVENIRDYVAFYQNLYFNDFRTKPGVPWTGLGYTYDWGNPELPVGASEFILIPGASYEIKRVVKTMDYFRE